MTTTLSFKLQSQVFSTLFFTHLLAALGTSIRLEFPDLDKWPEFSNCNLEGAMFRLQRITGNQDFLLIPALLRYHYTVYGESDELHPWHGLLSLSTTSIVYACKSTQILPLNTPDQATTAMFKELRTYDGKEVPTTPIKLILAYNQVLPKLYEISQIVSWLNSVLLALKTTNLTNRILKNINQPTHLGVNYRGWFTQLLPDLEQHLDVLETHLFVAPSSLFLTPPPDLGIKPLN